MVDRSIVTSTASSPGGFSWTREAYAKVVALSRTQTNAQCSKAIEPAPAASFRRELHPVISRLDAVRQALPQHLVVEIGVHVGDHRALRLEAVDPGERIID